MAIEINSRSFPVSSNHVRKDIARPAGIEVLPSATLRISGLLLFSMIALFTVWLARNINLNNISGVLVLMAFPITATSLLLAVFNSWSRVRPVYPMMPHGSESMVGIIIPTFNEPIDMVLRTVESVLVQSGWPRSAMAVVVGDDGGREELRLAIEELRMQYPDTALLHWMKAHKTKGKAKSGNLNACMDYLLEQFPGLEFVETRDCDDLVPEGIQFLRNAISALVSRPKAGFAQFIKDGETPAGDPFGCREQIFYAELQSRRLASNAVVACGSGLVWRVNAVNSVGGFQYTGPVEDLDTSYQIAKQGWDTLFVPILGAWGQIQPSDLPNFFKQRLTWCMDTTRLMLGKWQDNPLFASGLSLRQRMQYLEVLLSYIHSFAAVVYMLLPLTSLFFTPFVKGSDWTFVLLFAVAVECYLAIYAKGHYASLWRSRMVSAALAFGYVQFVLNGLLYYSNPSRFKYVVTRKVQVADWYAKEALVSYTYLAANLAAFAYAMFAYDMPSGDRVLLTVFSGFAVALLSHAARLSWFSAFEKVRVWLSKVSQETFWGMLALLVGYVISWFF